MFQYKPGVSSFMPHCGCDRKRGRGAHAKFWDVVKLSNKNFVGKCALGNVKIKTNNHNFCEKLKVTIEVLFVHNLFCGKFSTVCQKLQLSALPAVLTDDAAIRSLVLLDARGFNHCPVQ